MPVTKELNNISLITKLLLPPANELPVSDWLDGEVGDEAFDNAIPKFAQSAPKEPATPQLINYCLRTRSLKK